MLRWSRKKKPKKMKTERDREFVRDEPSGSLSACLAAFFLWKESMDFPYFYRFILISYWKERVFDRGKKMLRTKKLKCGECGKMHPLLKSYHCEMCDKQLCESCFEKGRHGEHMATLVGHQRRSGGL